MCGGYSTSTTRGSMMAWVAGNGSCGVAAGLVLSGVTAVAAIFWVGGVSTTLAAGATAALPAALGGVLGMAGTLGAVRMGAVVAAGAAGLGASVGLGAAVAAGAAVGNIGLAVSASLASAGAAGRGASMGLAGAGVLAGAQAANTSAINAPNRPSLIGLRHATTLMT